MGNRFYLGLLVCNSMPKNVNTGMDSKPRSLILSREGPVLAPREEWMNNNSLIVTTVSRRRN